MKRLLLFLVTAIILTSGCDCDPCKNVVCHNMGVCKDGKCTCASGYTGANCETPIIINPGTSTNGSVSGTVWPREVVTSMTLSSTSGGANYSASFGSKDEFSFSDVTPGNYSLNITTNSSTYPSPAAQPVTVTYGNNVALGQITIPFKSSAQKGKVLFTIDGVQHTLFSNNFTATYSSGNLEISGPEPTSPAYYYFSLEATDINGQGVYTLDHDPSILRLIHYPAKGANADGHWVSNNGSSVQLEISTINTTDHILSGTFKGTLAPQGATTGTKTINGSFTNISY